MEIHILSFSATNILEKALNIGPILFVKSIISREDPHKHYKMWVLLCLW